MRVDYKNKLGDKLMLNNKSSYKYEKPYKGHFEITQIWKNGMATLQMIQTTVRYYSRRINPYEPKTDVDDVHL